MERFLMPKLLRSLACIALFFFSTVPTLPQSARSKPKSPGEIAAAERLAMEKRAACQREARAQKLNYLQRRRFVRDCIKR
jgi:hypothetical protein